MKLNYLVSRPKISPIDSDIINALDELKQNLYNTLNEKNASVQLIRFIFFPIGGLLRHFTPIDLPNKGTIILMEILNRLSGFWVTEGMTIREWEQLWILSSMSFLNSSKLNLSENVILSCIQLLNTLSTQSTDNSHLSEEHVKLLTVNRMSIFGNVITKLLEFAQFHKFFELRLQSLMLLKSFINFFLFDNPEIVATILPGIASCVTKISTSSALVQVELVVNCIDILRSIILSTLADDRCLHLQPIQLTSLSDLGNKLDIQTLEVKNEHNEDDIPVATSLFAPAGFKSEENKDDDKKVRGISWLKATTNQIRLVLISISSLNNHQSTKVRKSLIELSTDLIKDCILTLESCHHVLVSNLLVLSIKEDKAKDNLMKLLKSSQHLKFIEPLLKLHARNDLRMIPIYIQSKESHKVINCCLRIEAIANLSYNVNYSPIDDILGPQGGVEKWGWPLIDCIPLANPPLAGEASSVNASRSILWSTTADDVFEISIDDNDNSSNPWFGFPNMPIESLDYESTLAIQKSLVALGRAFGNRSIHSIEYFFNLAQRFPNSKSASSALYLSSCLIQGASRSSNNKGIDKLAMKFAKNVVKLNDEVELSNDDDNEDESKAKENENRVNDELIEYNDKNLPTEYKKGIEPLETLTDRFEYNKSKYNKMSGRFDKRIKSTLLSLMSLRLLATTSWILGYNFRPQLNATLYYMLSRLDSSTLTLKEHARVALANVSFNCGYASSAGAILDNADYVLNSVASRLSPVRLDVAAPRVLIASVRLVGASLVNRLHGVVEDIFESLDDLHDIPLIGEGLLAVLDTIVQVMSDDFEVLPDIKDVVVEKDDSRPNTLEDFNNLIEYLSSLKYDNEQEQKDYEDIINEPTPHRPWEELRENHDESKEEITQDEPKEEMTRSQSLCLQIMKKCLNFLTHPIAFIRSRTLNLIESSVRVLMRSNRQTDVLPVLHKAWPYICHRLVSKSTAKFGEEYEEDVYVILSAFNLLKGLAIETGEFMNSRIVEDAYPKIKQTLAFEDRFKKGNENSKNIVKSNINSNNGIEYWQNSITAKRAHLASINAMNRIVIDIPIPDELVWELANDFKVFLDKPDIDIHDAIIELYDSLCLRNVDIVWLIIKDLPSNNTKLSIDKLINLNENF